MKTLTRPRALFNPRETEPQYPPGVINWGGGVPVGAQLNVVTEACLISNLESNWRTEIAIAAQLACLHFQFGRGCL